MHFRMTAAVLLAMTGPLACAKGGDAAKDPTKTAATGSGAPVAHSDSVLRIAMIAKSSTNPVFLAARTGAEAAAKDLSEKNHMKVEVVWLTPPQEDGQVQAQRIQQAVNDGADAVSSPVRTPARSPERSTTRWTAVSPS